MLPVTALKYNPLTMELKLPTSFMSPSAVRNKALADTEEMFVAQGYDLDDIHATLSRETPSACAPTDKSDEKEADRIHELAEEEKAKHRNPSAPMVDPETIMQLNLKEPIAVPRRNAGGASVGTRDTTCTSQASVDRKDGEFRWEHSLAIEEKKRTEAQRQLRDAEMVANVEKRRAEKAESAISDIAEKLRAQGIDPATVLSQEQMLPSSMPQSNPSVRFSSPTDTQNSKSQQRTTASHTSSSSSPPSPTNSQENFPSLPSKKKEGAGSFPSGKAQRRAR